MSGLILKKAALFKIKIKFISIFLLSFYIFINIYAKVETDRLLIFSKNISKKIY